MQISRPIFFQTEQHYFPVMDQQGKLARIFSINDVRGVLFAAGIGQLVVMKDIGTSEIITTSPSEDLNSVWKKIYYQEHRQPASRAR